MKTKEDPISVILELVIVSVPMILFALLCWNFHMPKWSLFILGLLTAVNMIYDGQKREELIRLKEKYNIQEK